MTVRMLLRKCNTRRIETMIVLGTMGGATQPAHGTALATVECLSNESAQANA